MKIAFFLAQGITNKHGGCEHYFIETAKELSEFNNIQADIISMDDEFSYKVNKLISLYYFKKRSKKNVRASVETIKQKAGKANYYKAQSVDQLRNKLLQYDVVYSKNELLELIYFKFFLKYRRVPPVVLGVHTPHHYPVATSFHAKTHNFFYLSKFYNFLASEVKCIHVINSESLKILTKQLKHSKIIKIPYGFDINRFKKNAKKYRFKHEWKKEKINILWVGRLGEQKGINDLIKIISLINKSQNFSKVEWNIFGDGPCKQKILSCQRQWKNVNYFGYVKNNYIADIMKYNDFFISTSKWEVSPFNIIEAQSMNLPIISYNIPGPNDIIIENKTGTLVNSIQEFVDAINLMIQNSKSFDNCDQFIKNQLNPKIIYPKIIQMFKWCIKNSAYENNSKK